MTAIQEKDCPLPGTRRAIGSDTLFVVSGGARGVTAHCVIRLAQRFRCRFILLGRTVMGESEPPWAAGCDDAVELARRAAAALAAHGEKSSPRAVQRAAEQVIARREVAATLQAVHEAGGEATYLAADVTDAAALRAALVPELVQAGPLLGGVGIIHGAGLLSDKRIERKTEQDFDAVYGPKVQGLANLLDCLPPERLRYLVLFSSAAGFYGNPGQADYAMANEVLNRAAYAVQRAQPACRVVSLNWGPWDGGMVTPALKERFQRRGISVIPLDGGAQLLMDALCADSGAVQVVAGAPWRSAPPARAPVRQTYRVRRRLTLAANPFLRDHVVGGTPVLPLMCAMSWLAGTCEQLHPGHTFFAAENVRVLKGIVFDEGLADEYILEVVASPGDGGTVVCDATISSESSGGSPRYHYAGRLTLVRSAAERLEPPRFDRFDLTPDNTAIPGTTLYEDGTLFHGRAFRGVDRVLNVNSGRLTLCCVAPEVPEVEQGQFPIRALNGYVADVVFQAQVVWARLHYGAASLPLHAERGEQFRPLEFEEPLYVTLEVRSHAAHKLVADTYVHDAQGRLSLRVRGSEVTISKQLNRLFAPAALGVPATPAIPAASTGLAASRE